MTSRAFHLAGALTAVAVSGYAACGRQDFAQSLRFRDHCGSLTLGLPPARKARLELSRIALEILGFIVTHPVIPAVRRNRETVFRDVVVFLFAATLAVRAGDVYRGAPLLRVVARLMAQPLLPFKCNPNEARRAALRALRYLSKLRLVTDTCVARSLVVGVLLSHLPNVRLHIGFDVAGGRETAPSGHAWVTVDGVNVSDASPARDYSEATSIELRRRS
jgi:hypothetical protein